MIGTYILITLIAILGYSEDYFGTVLVCRPIVLGPLVGLALGDPVQGIIIGATLELVFMGVMSIGAAIPPDIISAGVLGTAFAIMSGKDAAVALALAVPISLLAQMIKSAIYVFRSVFNKKFDQYAEAGDYNKLQWLHFGVFLIVPVTMGILIFLTLFLGSAAMESFLNAIPAWVNTGLSSAGNLLPAVGVAMLMSLMFSKKYAPYYFLGFVLAAYMGLPVIAIGILGVILAVIITSLNNNDTHEAALEDGAEETAESAQSVSTLVTKRDIRNVFFRSLALEASFNFERMQATGFCYSMIPVLKKIYNTKESMSKALQRHMAFFNTTPHSSTFIMGLAASMEVQNSQSEDFDDESINAVKVGLMGPFAGIFDSVFWGTLRVIAAGVGTSLALQGSALGAIFFLLIFNVPHFLFRYNATFWGYNAGNKFLQRISSSGMMDKLTFGATILGMMVVGGMTSALVPFATTISFGVGESVTQLQDILNQIMPNMLPLGLTFLVYYLFKKNVKVTWLLLGVFVFGFILSLIHVI